MKTENLFSSLVENGLDFLSTAIAEFESSPKHSAINFYTAVELLLKARLMAEHWSLVVSRDPDRAKFESGDFSSVTFEEAVRRLDKIIDSPIQSRAVEAFDAVRRHRNRMVHFFHPSQNDKKTIETIAAEQLRAWGSLNHLLMNQWGETFGKYQGDFKKIERALQKHREYLTAKFDSTKALIDDRTKKGAKFKHCSACQFPAAEESTLLGDLHRANCLVCSWVHDWLDIKCSECGAVTEFDGGDTFKCQNGHKLDEGELFDLLDEDDSNPYEGEQSITPANCGNCDGYHSVLKYQDKYLCLHCLDLSEIIQFCGWCSEANTGDMEDSYWRGCNVCDGRSGWDKDD